jgi:hypothetical protein
MLADEDLDSLILEDKDGDEDNGSLDLEDINLQALAEEIYTLLRQELRLERERRGWPYAGLRR